MIPSFPFLIGSLIFSTLLSWGLGFWARSLNIVDTPDGERKFQDAPIPRLGGVAIGIASCLTILTLVGVSLWHGDPANALSLEVVGVVSVAFLAGLMDDLIDTPALLKLGLLSAAFFAAASLGLTPEALTTPFGDTSVPVVLILGSALWLLVFTNAVNFMDGSNGLAIGCMMIMFTALALISIDQGSFTPSLWWAALIGAILGFLIHNLQGKLYAGDAGSLGLGALFAGLGLVSGLEVWTIATLALPFLIDTLMTLIWRAKHGRPWLKPHLDHAYQRLRAAGWSHLETAFLYWGLSTVCAVAGLIAAKAGGAAPFAIFWTLCLAGIALWTLHRRATRGS